MNRELWEIIATLYGYLNPIREAKSPAVIAMLDLVQLRANLRTQLELLRSLITKQYSERDAYLVLFPLTAHCDEIIKKMILDITHVEWPPLQQELYQVVDAGDLFFELLDSSLQKPETLSIVYEVYYFCLNDGFCGRYSATPSKLNDWLEKLRSHCMLEPIPTVNTVPTVAKKWSNFRVLNRLYYVACGLSLILFYFFLSFLASTWQPSV